MWLIYYHCNFNICFFHYLQCQLVGLSLFQYYYYYFFNRRVTVDSLNWMHRQALEAHIASLLCHMSVNLGWCRLPIYLIVSEWMSHHWMKVGTGEFAIDLNSFCLQYPFLSVCVFVYQCSTWSTERERELNSYSLAQYFDILMILSYIFFVSNNSGKGHRSLLSYYHHK